MRRALRLLIVIAENTGCGIRKRANRIVAIARTKNQKRYQACSLRSVEIFNSNIFDLQIRYRYKMQVASCVQLSRTRLYRTGYISSYARRMTYHR